MLVQGGVGAKERSLLVEGSTVVGDKRGGDEHGIAAHKDGGGRVDREVSSGAVGAAKAAVGV